MKSIAAALAFGASLSLSAVAFAQTGDKDKGYFETKQSDGSSVVFKDDLFSGTSLGPTDGTIRARPRAARHLLIRPRLEFVAELTKSVEAL